MTSKARGRTTWRDPSRMAYNFPHPAPSPRMCCRSSPSLGCKPYESAAAAAAADCEIASSLPRAPPCGAGAADAGDRRPRPDRAMRKTLRGRPAAAEPPGEVSLGSRRDPEPDGRGPPAPADPGNGNSGRNKLVRFDHVNIRYHAQVPGVHPECREGAPVELSWFHFGESRRSVDDHEATSPASARRHRGREAFRLTPLQRHYRLSSAGHGPDEIRDAQQFVLRAQTQREITRRRLATPLGRLGEAIRERAEGLRPDAPPALAAAAAARRRPGAKARRPLPELAAKAPATAS